MLELVQQQFWCDFNYEEIFLIFSGLPSPSKHYSLRVDNAVPMVTQPPQALQLQPQLIAQQQVPTQQFVPVSVMEQNGRQMLVTVSFWCCDFETCTWYWKFLTNDDKKEFEKMIRFFCFIFLHRMVLLHPGRHSVKCWCHRGSSYRM